MVSAYHHRSIRCGAGFSLLSGAADTRGPRIVNQQTKAEMKKILAEITSGQFAKEWRAEYEGRMKTSSSCMSRTIHIPWKWWADAVAEGERAAK